MTHSRYADRDYWNAEEAFNRYTDYQVTIEDEYLGSEYRKFVHIPLATLVDWEAEDSFIRRDQ